MRHLRLAGVSPYANLAAEEFLLTRSDGSFFMLWQNEPSVIVGCHQNAYAEVNAQEAERLGVRVARRMTGGGAVYHDLGNINFSLIGGALPDSPAQQYELLCKPLIAALLQCGIRAEMGGRNDLLAGGKKIAGCALRQYRQRALVHGALLYSTDLRRLSSLLTPHSAKFSGKAVKSVSSRVANVQDLLPRPLPLPDFMQKWADNAAEVFGGTAGALTDAQQAEIDLLAQKYADPHWIWGEAQSCPFRKTGKTGGGIVEVQINAEAQRIKSIRIFGDFFGSRSIAELEGHLEGCPHTPAALRAALDAVDLDAYMHGVKAEELAGLMF